VCERERERERVRPAEVRSSISCLEACCAAVLPPSVNADIKVSSSSGVCASAAVTSEMPNEDRNISVETSSLNMQRFKGTFLDDRSVQHVQHSPTFFFRYSRRCLLRLLLPRNRCNVSQVMYAMFVDRLTHLDEGATFV
jgi:hypothetical protein